MSSIISKYLRLVTLHAHTHTHLTVILKIYVTLPVGAERNFSKLSVIKSFSVNNVKRKTEFFFSTFWQENIIKLLVYAEASKKCTVGKHRAESFGEVWQVFKQ